MRKRLNGDLSDHLVVICRLMFCFRNRNMSEKYEKDGTSEAEKRKFKI